MGLFDFFWDFLSWLGLLQKKCRILFLGLDNAGKTTLLYKLKTGTVRQFNPTIRPNREEFSLGRLTVSAFDLGGHHRDLWREYFVSCDAVVFLVDIADPERLEEAKNELHGLLADELLRGVPVAVLGNKADVQDGCLSKLEFVNGLGISDLLSDRELFIGLKVLEKQVAVGSVYNDVGYPAVFAWIAGVL